MSQRHSRVGDIILFGWSSLYKIGVEKPTVVNNRETVVWNNISDTCAASDTWISLAHTLFCYCVSFRIDVWNNKQWVDTRHIWQRQFIDVFSCNTMINWWSIRTYKDCYEFLKFGKIYQFTVTDWLKIKSANCLAEQCERFKYIKGVTVALELCRVVAEYRH